MTVNEARHLIIEGMDYAAYRETDSSLYDSDKNRLRPKYVPLNSFGTGDRAVTFKVAILGLPKESPQR
jgi:hypothetical protein